MGVFSSALDGAIKGVQQGMMDNLYTENDILKRNQKLLMDGAIFYRAVAEGQLINAACYYGNYKAARDIMKKRYNDLPEKDEEFLELKKRYVTEYAQKRQKLMQEKMAELGMQKAYATVREIYDDKVKFVTVDEVIAEAMIDPEYRNKNPAPNYVTSPFGSSAPQEEKKKEKGSWFFGKK